MSVQKFVWHLHGKTVGFEVVDARCQYRYYAENRDIDRDCCHQSVISYVVCCVSMMWVKVTLREPQVFSDRKM